MNETRRIRSGIPADLDTIVRLNIAMALESEGLRLDPENLRSGVLASLANPDRGKYFLAEEKEKIVGQIRVTSEWSDWNNQEYWWIQNVYVEPPHRRRGVYSSLHNHVRALAKSAGACGLQLYVDRKNTGAQSVYQRLAMRPSHYLIYEHEKI